MSSSAHPTRSRRPFNAADHGFDMRVDGVGRGAERAEQSDSPEQGTRNINGGGAEIRVGTSGLSRRFGMVICHDISLFVT